MSLFRQSIALVLTTKNKHNTTYTRNTKEKQKKTALANKNIYTLIWYAFYDLRSGNRVGPILTAPEPTQGLTIESNSKWCHCHLMHIVFSHCSGVHKEKICLTYAGGLPVIWFWQMIYDHEWHRESSSSVLQGTCFSHRPAASSHICEHCDMLKSSIMVVTIILLINFLGNTFTECQKY